MRHMKPKDFLIERVDDFCLALAQVLQEGLLTEFSLKIVDVALLVEQTLLLHCDDFVELSDILRALCLYCLGFALGLGLNFGLL